MVIQWSLVCHASLLYLSMMVFRNSIDHLHFISRAMGRWNKWLYWPGPSWDWLWAHDQYSVMSRHMHIAWWRSGRQCLPPLDALCSRQPAVHGNLWSMTSPEPAFTQSTQSIIWLTFWLTSGDPVCLFQFKLSYSFTALLLLVIIWYWFSGLVKIKSCAQECWFTLICFAYELLWSKNTVIAGL